MLRHVCGPAYPPFPGPWPRLSILRTLRPLKRKKARRCSVAFCSLGGALGYSGVEGALRSPPVFSKQPRGGGGGSNAVRFWDSDVRYGAHRARHKP